MELVFTRSIIWAALSSLWYWSRMLPCLLGFSYSLKMEEVALLLIGGYKRAEEGRGLVDWKPDRSCVMGRASPIDRELALSFSKVDITE